MNHFLCGCCIVVMLCSCHDQREIPGAQRAAVKDSVTGLMMRISADISKGGPTQWLNYFDDNPGFFMATDGAVKFGDFQSATTYTRDTVPQFMSRISLTWDHLRIDSLTPEFASIGADFSEGVTLTNGQTMSYTGFFTAVAHYDGTKWKLRDLNWAGKPR
ncbi:MAG TPA: hypothetical protein VNV35_04255 [Puia sp.]|jgi:hypothetical protein|nr:hypothetical protein [Puia sp.]